MSAALRTPAPDTVITSAAEEASPTRMNATFWQRPAVAKPGPGDHLSVISSAFLSNKPGTSNLTPTRSARGPIAQNLG
jgi:hypothetical protein